MKRDLDPSPLQPLMTLLELGAGGRGRVVALKTTKSRNVETLSTYGILPGTLVRLLQTNPAVVLELGNTSLALDRDVARQILVRAEPD